MPLRGSRRSPGSDVDETSNLCGRGHCRGMAAAAGREGLSHGAAQAGRTRGDHAMGRRRRATAAAAFGVVAPAHAMSAAERALRATEPEGVAGAFSLPPLPWPAETLEPVISKGAVELHHQKHHRGYVMKLNALVEGTPLATMTPRGGDPLDRGRSRRSARSSTTRPRCGTTRSSSTGSRRRGRREVPGALHDLDRARLRLVRHDVRPDGQDRASSDSAAAGRG